MGTQEAKEPKQRFIDPSHDADEIAYAVIGAAIEVHRHLGPGLIEAAYERALAVELDARGIPFERQVLVPTEYKGIMVGEQRLDFLVDGLVVVELKAVEALAGIHTAQVLSYLRAGGYELGLLINFNVALLQQGVRRVVRPALWFDAALEQGFK